MKTIDLVVGKRYKIHGRDCEVVHNSSYWRVLDIVENKFYSQEHGGYCKPNNIGTECQIHKNNGCAEIIEL